MLNFFFNKDFIFKKYQKSKIKKNKKKYLLILKNFIEKENYKKNYCHISRKNIFLNHGEKKNIFKTRTCMEGDFNLEIAILPYGFPEFDLETFPVNNCQVYSKKFNQGLVYENRLGKIYFSSIIISSEKSCGKGDFLSKELNLPIIEISDKLMVLQMIINKQHKNIFCKNHYNSFLFSISHSKELFRKNGELLFSDCSEKPITNQINIKNNRNKAILILECGPEFRFVPRESM